MPKVASARQKSTESLSQAIVNGLHRKADDKTKAWFTNYVKGTTWIGCKTPVVRKVVQDAVKERKASLSDDVYMQHGIDLIQHEASDVKLAGMILLSEHYSQLATMATLERLDRQVLSLDHVDDWSSADWFAVRVLQKIILAGDEKLVDFVLSFATRKTNLWHRRNAVVPFVHYYKNRDKLPTDIGARIVQACEQSLLLAPDERFCQTGIAWILCNVLMEPFDRDVALAMVLKHGSLWTTEAKKSLTEKMSKTDPRKKQSMSLK